jgi:hypothetical protein
MIGSQPHFPLYPKQAAVALAVARETALRFKDSSQIGMALTLAQGQTAFPKSIYWRPYGIAQGYAGLAVMCGYLDACFPDERWDIIGHQYLEIATRGVEKQTQVSIGLFSGLSGLAFAVWYLSCQGTRYGGITGMEWAESLFATDSRTVAELLYRLQTSKVALERSMLAVLSVDQLLAGLGLTEADRLQWLQRYEFTRNAVGPAYRQSKKGLRSLLQGPEYLSERWGRPDDCPSICQAERGSWAPSDAPVRTGKKRRAKSISSRTVQQFSPFTLQSFARYCPCPIKDNPWLTLANPRRFG